MSKRVIDQVKSTTHHISWTQTRWNAFH